MAELLGFLIGSLLFVAAGAVFLTVLGIVAYYGATWVIVAISGAAAIAIVRLSWPRPPTWSRGRHWDPDDLFFAAWLTLILLVFLTIALYGRYPEQIEAIGNFFVRAVKREGV